MGVNLQQVGVMPHGTEDRGVGREDVAMDRDAVAAHNQRRVAQHDVAIHLLRHPQQPRLACHMGCTF